MDILFPSVVTRYYQCYGGPDKDNPDHIILKHSNGVCLLCLSPKHAAITGDTIEKIDFFGKESECKSKQYPKIERNTVIAKLYCKSGNTYDIFSCISGFVLEFNKTLLKHPDLIDHKPLGAGYIAMLKSVGKRQKEAFENLKRFETTECILGSAEEITEEDEAEAPSANKRKRD